MPVAMGAVRNRHVSTARMSPHSRPSSMSTGLAPQAMNSGPSMNSVPAVCSPAYMPQKEVGPFHAFGGTGSRSYSLTGCFVGDGSSLAMGFLFLGGETGKGCVTYAGGDDRWRDAFA